MVTPTGYTALDLVGFTDKGPYSALENYVKNDLAHYAGSIWRCKIDDTTNVTPAENANWTVFVSERSNLVEASIAPIETSPATAAHDQGSQLFYNDTLYKAKTAIAIGDSLVVDTNIEAAPEVTTQLEAKANTADLGTAAAKDSTNAVTSGSTDLVESGAVASSIQTLTNQVSQLNFDGAGAHNSIYRGKYLGAEVTAEQYTAISSGKFTDLYIGDYWTIGGVNYRIGAFDYWLRTGDTQCTTHHVLLVPDTNLVNGQMNSTNTTTGGYAGSDLKTGENSNTALADAKAIIEAAFGSANILTHKELFTSSVSGNNANGWGWYSSKIDLMNENMVYGSPVCGKGADGSLNYNVGIDKSQIKLFAERPDLITNRANWWLRDVVSAVGFAYVNDSGAATVHNASNSLGIRPAFAIKA